MKSSTSSLARHLCFMFGLLLCMTYTHAGTGILELDSKPGGAEVFVDGKKKGTTPETEGQKLKMELAEGDHEEQQRRPRKGTR